MSTENRAESARPWQVCDRCNFDTHTCPGCGSNLPHGVEVCSDCDPTEEDENDCGCRVGHPRWCAWNGPCCDDCSHGSDEAHAACCGPSTPPEQAGP